MRGGWEQQGDLSPMPFPSQPLLSAFSFSPTSGSSGSSEADRFVARVVLRPWKLWAQGLLTQLAPALCRSPDPKGLVPDSPSLLGSTDAHAAHWACVFLSVSCRHEFFMARNLSCVSGPSWWLAVSHSSPSWLSPWPRAAAQPAQPGAAPQKQRGRSHTAPVAAQAVSACLEVSLPLSLSFFSHLPLLCGWCT